MKREKFSLSRDGCNRFSLFFCRRNSKEKIALLFFLSLYMGAIDLNSVRTSRNPVLCAVSIFPHTSLLLSSYFFFYRFLFFLAMNYSRAFCVTTGSITLTNDAIPSSTYSTVYRLYAHRVVYIVGYTISRLYLGVVTVILSEFSKA